MALFQIVTVLMVTLHFVFGGGGHGHGHGSAVGELGANGHAQESKDWYLTEVTGDVGGLKGAFNITHLRLLLEKLNFVKNCNASTTSAHAKCNLCFTAENLMDWFNQPHNKTLSQPEVEKLLQGLLYVMVAQPVESNCTNVVSAIKAVNNADMYEVFKASKYKIGVHNANDSLKNILIDLRKNIAYQFTTVEALPCYDQKDVIYGTNTTSDKITKAAFDWITPFLMHETIDGRCIDINKVHRTPINGHMRGADWYVDEVMGDVGSNGTIFTEAQLKLLLEKLNFKTCDAKTDIMCNLCFNASDIMEWFQPANGKTYTTEEFHNVLHGIIYLIAAHDEQNAKNCEAEKNRIKQLDSSNVSKLFTDFTRWGMKTNAPLKSVQLLLDDIKYTMGDKLESTPCYNSDDVLFGTFIYDNDIDAEELEWIIGFLGHEVIDGRCLLPGKELFIKDTLTQFGNGTYLTQEQFKEMVEKLKLGGEHKEDDHGHEHGEDDDHDHKRRKRRAINLAIYNAEIKKCYNPDELLRIFDVRAGDVIDEVKLKEMETALIQQIGRETCATEEKKKDSGKGYDDWQPWIATMISVLILTIGSCAGYLATPLQNRPWFPYLMMFMIALAVAVLTGDGIMHLFPHALGLHSHGSDDGHAHTASETLGKDSFIWKSLLFLLGGYIFFTFEVFMRAFSPTEHSHLHDPAKRTQINGTSNPAYEKGAEAAGNSNAPVPYYEANKDLVISKKAIPIREFKTVAWMILLGDALHNFMDGLAIGVAFTADWPSGKFGGISTTIAIFCHEVPHELGDFAVLLASGLSVNQALVMNYISALVAFLGGFVGCGIGTNSNATPWIFALAGGLFVYMALTNMLPEALNSSYLRDTPWKSILILQSGVIIGYVIMFVLAIYEGEIHTSLE